MLKLLKRTLVNRAYQLTRTLLYPARAETVESTSRTLEDGGRERLWSGCEPKPVSADQIHSTHGTQSPRARETASSIVYINIYIYIYSRWTSSLPSCLWSQRIFPSLPGSRFTIFYRDASSALLQLVNQWLNFTYSRSHAFRYERKNTNPTLVRIELTTSAMVVRYTWWLELAHETELRWKNHLFC